MLMTMRAASIMTLFDAKGRKGLLKGPLMMKVFPLQILSGNCLRFGLRLGEILSRVGNGALLYSLMQISAPGVCNYHYLIDWRSSSFNLSILGVLFYKNFAQH
jgi:hypothetical protein